ncbi:MAG TPA: alkaline phosphatase family protein [Solirubrobacteraceae bacterium]|nr:alkaline phosphatase family protein [Solirubrobacteraceae bacterium]
MSDPTISARCDACEAELAAEARYCARCGEPTLRERPWYAHPVAAIVALTVMVAFGAAIGATIGGSRPITLAGAPLVLERSAAHAASRTDASRPGSTPGRSDQHGATGSSAPGGQPTAGSASGSSAGAGSAGAGGSSAGGGSSGAGGSSAGASSSGEGGSSAGASSSGAGGSSAAGGTSPGGSSTATAGGSTPPGGHDGLPPIRHVFLVVLGDQGFSQTFGSADRYLADALPRQGELIDNYYAVAGGELANEIALISGQGPTPQTQAGCPVFTRIEPASAGADGQIIGQGCVYPPVAQTLAGQIEAAHLSWRAYVQGQAGAASGPQACRHPRLGAADGDQAPSAGDPYVTWRNPFVYFSSLIEARSCTRRDVDLSRLPRDLASASTTPNLAYIAPDPCDDGDPQPCRAGAVAGIRPLDRFLRNLVAELERSPAYRDGGLIAITFDEAQQSGADADASACCERPVYPNLPAGAAGTGGTSTAGTGGTSAAGTIPTASTSATTGAPTGPGSPTTTDTSTATSSPSRTNPSTSPATPATTGVQTSAGASAGPGAPAPTGASTTTAGSTGTGTSSSATTAPPAAPPSLGARQSSPSGGGGRVGLLLISPWIKPGTIDAIDYANHFSLLAALEDLFGLPRLGYARRAGPPAFSATTFNGAGPRTGEVRRGVRRASRVRT